MFLLILVDLSLMNVLDDLVGKFDSDNVKVLVFMDTDEDVNNDLKDTNSMEAM